MGRRRSLVFCTTIIPVFAMLISGCAKSADQQDPRKSEYYAVFKSDYQTAATKMDKECSLHPDSLEAEYYRGAVEAEMGNPEEAVAKLSRLLEKHPRYSYAYSERSVANLKSLHYQDAETDASQAIELAPEVARNYIRRAMARVVLHQPEKAMSDLKKATALDANEDPQFVKVLTAVALMDEHRYQEALPLLTGAVGNGKDVRPFVRRGVCYAHLKDWTKALEDSDQALKVNSKDLDARVLHASLLSATGKRDEARKEFTAILKDAPNGETVADTADLGSSITSVSDAANTALALKNPKMAKQILQRTESRRPLDGEEVYSMGKAELAAGDLFRAAKLFNECLATQPTWGEPRVELIRLYVRDHLPDKAKELQKEGLQLPLSDADRRQVASAI